MIDNQKLVNVFADLLDIDPNEPPMTDEEADEFLREMGYDPDEIGKRMAQVATEALQRQAAKLGLTMEDGQDNHNGLL